MAKYSFSLQPFKKTHTIVFQAKTPKKKKIHPPPKKRKIKQYVEKKKMWGGPKTWRRDPTVPYTIPGSHT